MTGKILRTTVVPTGNSVTPGATVLPFSIPRDDRHFTKEEVKRATLARELHHFLGHPHDRALKLTLDQGHLTHHTHLTSHDIDLMTDFYGSCLACTADKMHNADLHVTSFSPPSTSVGGCVFFDLQQLTTALVGGNTQALIAIDDRSGYISVLGSKYFKVLATFCTSSLPEQSTPYTMDLFDISDEPTPVDSVTYQRCVGALIWLLKLRF